MEVVIGIIQDDHGYDLNFIVKDQQEVVVDISNSIPYFDFQLLSDPSVHYKNAMTVISGPDGTCRYTVLADDFKVSGTYSAQIVVVYTAGPVLSFGGITLECAPSLPVNS